MRELNIAAARPLSDAINEIHYANTRLLIRHGKALVAVVPISDLTALEQLSQQAYDRLIAEAWKTQGDEPAASLEETLKAKGIKTPPELPPAETKTTARPKAAPKRRAKADAPKAKRTRSKARAK
jgi:hypothetical protein